MTAEISRCGQFGGEIITDVLGAKPHYSKQYIGTNLLAEMNTVQQWSSMVAWLVSSFSLSLPLLVPGPLPPAGPLPSVVSEA